MKTWKDEYIETNGIRMHYLTAGKGPLVVLLHGFPQFSYSWRHQIPSFADKFRVVAPDLRGYGETDKPEAVEEYTSEKLMGDIVGLVHALGYEKAHIVGHDWGGAVAWNIAIHNPKIVDRLIVLNCPHPKLFAQALKSNYRQMLRSWYLFFFQLPYIPESLFNMFSKEFTKGIFRGTATNKEAFTDEDLELYQKELQKPGAVRGAMNYYRAAFQNRHSVKNEGKAKQIAAPTLLIWGEDDKALGKELTYHMEPLFSGPFKLQYIPHCGHWVNEEQPAKVNQLILEHLQS